MSYEVKRVPLDFDWPLDETWHGYIYPSNENDCLECGGLGLSKRADDLEKMWWGRSKFKPEDNGSTPFRPEDEAIEWLVLHNLKAKGITFPDGYKLVKENYAYRIEAERLCDHFNSAWMYHLNDQDVEALLKYNVIDDLIHKYGRAPTAKEVSIENIDSIGISAYVPVLARCEHEGVSYTCPQCNGTGQSIKGTKWKRVEPPEGEGYQMWQTVSEGSPVSPVFETPEELASFMEGSATGIDENVPFDRWLEMINGNGFCPSAIVEDGIIKSSLA